MSDNLRKLEREVEIARSRLKSDLSVLTSPRTYASFKDDLKSEANSTLYSVVDGLKARAAANPAAALAIGAGIAWRAIEKPPIAAALIGAGLFSLFRTTPRESAPFERRDYLAEGRERLKEQVSDFAGEIRDGAADAVSAATGHAGNIASAAADKVQDFAATAATKAKEHASSVSHLTSDAMSDATEWAEDVPARAGHVIQNASRAVEGAISDDDSRGRSIGYRFPALDERELITKIDEQAVHTICRVVRLGFRPPARVHISMPRDGGLGCGRPCVQLQRYLAIGNQHRHDGCHFPNDLRASAFAESRFDSNPSQAGRAHSSECGIKQTHTRGAADRERG